MQSVNHLHTLNRRNLSTYSNTHHTHKHTHTHTHTHAHTHTHTHAQAHTHKHTHAHTCTHAHTHARTHKHTNTNTHARTHTHTHNFLSNKGHHATVKRVYTSFELTWHFNIVLIIIIKFCSHASCVCDLLYARHVVHRFIKATLYWLTTPATWTNKKEID